MIKKIKAFFHVIKNKIHLLKENRKYSEKFVKLKVNSLRSKYKGAPDNVYRNKYFLIQEFVEANNIVRLSICRTRIKMNGAWQDRISWDELYEIKNKLGFEYFDAVEVFPKTEDYVNVANLRHIWILQKPLPFVWRSKKQRIIINEINKNAKIH